MSKVNLINITTDAEKTMAYLARVSSEDQRDDVNLLGYCAKHGHWSVFEMADMTVEIKTSRAIAQQILRHRSFHFQEFSQRYAEVEDLSYELCGARRKDPKNRQNSIDNLNEYVKESFEDCQKQVWDLAYGFYKNSLQSGIAKECARMLLPLNTATRMYMKGTIRDWVHYIRVRTDPSTQKEHRDVAQEIKMIFATELPTVYQACLTGDK